MRKTHLIYVGAVGLLLLGAACSKTTNINTSSEENSNVASVNEDTNSVSNENENGNVNRDVNEDRNTNSSEDSNTNSSGDHQQVSSGSLKVTGPETDATVESPIELQGTSDTDKVYVRAKSSTGGTMFTEAVTVRNGEFHVNLTVTLTMSKKITLEVFQKDASGNEVNLVSVPVTVKVESSSTNTNESVNGNENSNDNSNESPNDNANTNSSIY